MRLQHKVITAFLPLALFAGVGMTFLSRRVVHSILLQQMQSRGASLAADAGPAAEDGFVSRDEERLLPVLQSILVRGAVYAAALDVDGKVLAHTNVGETGLKYRDPATAQALRADGPTFHPGTFDDRAILDVAVPLWTVSARDAGEEFLLSAGRKEGRRKLGLLRVGIPMEEALQTERRISQQVFWVITGMLILALTPALYLTGRILRPVRLLAEATERLGRGDYGFQVRVLSQDELGHLSSRFNTMSQELRDGLQERLKIEEALRQSQKMDAVGQLAGGVAHDFNNLLTVITGCVDLLLKKASPVDEGRPLLEQISVAGSRAGSLTRKLLAFSRKQVLQTQVVNLNDVVSGMKDMLCRLLGENIDFQTPLEASLPAIKADPGQLEQMVMNLVVNARDAMPQGGRITVRTVAENLNQSLPSERGGVPAGRYVVFSVEDTGCGMTPEVKARVFEPFFTTKESGKGTGLGLSMVYGIIKQSGWHIHIDTEPGAGSTFRIYIPALDDVVKERKKDPVRADPGRGHETVLLVEDESMVRDLAAQLLTAQGYEVWSASNPLEAESLCEIRKKPVHLLLTDVVMPYMSGPEFVRKLAPRFPGMRTLFMSGYANLRAPQDALPPDAALLEKPFTPESLLRKVREVLDSVVK